MTCVYTELSSAAFVCFSGAVLIVFDVELQSLIYSVICKFAEFGAVLIVSDT